MNEYDMPDWVWLLIDDLHEHRFVCSVDRAALDQHVPSDVLEVAALIRARLQREAPFIREQAWDEGFTARGDEEGKQRKDPDYPIRRENPYTQIPF